MAAYNQQRIIDEALGGGGNPALLGGVMFGPGGFQAGTNAQIARGRNDVSMEDIRSRERMAEQDIAAATAKQGGERQDSLVGRILDAILEANPGMDPTEAVRQALSAASAGQQPE